MATTITVPAAKSMQGDLVLYSTSIEVRHLIKQNFYSVDKLDPENPENPEKPGYQRVLNRPRAKRLTNYILKGQEHQDVFLPTSILLATNKNIEHNPANNTITISEELFPFSVVDGQHRLEGLRMAAEEDNSEYILNFQVPINIAVSLDNISQMCHFLIVNTTQKSVDPGVEQRIYTRLTDLIGTEEIPSLPHWIQTIVDRGEINKAVKIVDYLNSEPTSPWHGKVYMANSEDRTGTTVNQGSFVQLIQRNILVANNPLNALNDFDKEKRIYLNYWKAVAALLDDGSKTVLYKYNGINIFCKFSIPFFYKLQGEGDDFTVNNMKSHLEMCFNAIEGEYAGVGESNWWYSGGQASGMNHAATTRIVQTMATALNSTGMNSSDIKI